MHSGTRRTLQKDAVAAALGHTDGFISARDLHHRLAENGSRVGMATVYRRLNALVAAGLADALPGHGEQLYRACEPGGHHHHLVCEICGKAVEITPPSEEWITETARTHGFTVTRHVLEVFGMCSDCGGTSSIE